MIRNRHLERELLGLTILPTLSHREARALAMRPHIVQKISHQLARLGELGNGDSIFLEDAAGRVLHFLVRESRSYNYNDAPLQEIFGSQGKRQLVLITCDGEWNQVKHAYNKRLVVFAELAPQGTIVGMDSGGDGAIGKPFPRE